MLLQSPVRPLYDDPPAGRGSAVSFDPPPAFVEDFWDWRAPLGGASVAVHTGRLTAPLRSVAARRDARLALVESAVVRAKGVRAGEAGAGDVALGDALADLAVSGRAAFAQFRTLAPTESTLLAEVMALAAATPGLAPGLFEDEARQALGQTLDRAYAVVWALTGAPSQRATLRPSLGWIAVSAEDDAPHAPVNVPCTGDPMGEINFSDLAVPITCRVALTLPGEVPVLDLPPAPIRHFPLDAGRQFQDLLHARERYDELILYVHGLGSRLEEAPGFKQRILAQGRARGKRYAVLSIDLPGFGYSSRLAFDRVTGGRPARFDRDDPRRSRFPFLKLYRDVLAQLANRVAGGYQHAVGGSLGGNLVLWLAEVRENGRYVATDTLRKFVSWSPASIWRSYERAPHPDLNEFDAVKALVLNRTRGRMETREGDVSRRGWFDVIQRGEPAGPVRISGWMNQNDVTREALLYLSEMYGPDWFRTFWATSYEQLVFSHQEPISPGARWPFRTINRPLLVCSGENDTRLGMDYYKNVQKVTGESPGVPGRRLLLRRTGHSIHDERPGLLASHAVRFLADPPAFVPGAPVAVVSRGPERLDVAAPATDGRVYHTAWHGGHHPWTSREGAWTCAGGLFGSTARVSLLGRRPDVLDAFCVAEDGRVYTAWYVDGVSDWSGVEDAWRNVGGVFPPGAPVAAVARKPEQMDLFCVAADGRVHTSWWTGGAEDWSGAGDRWRGVGGVFPPGAAVAALARRPEQMDLFCVAADGRVYTSWWTRAAGSWSGAGDRWRNIGGRFAAGAPLVAVARKPGQIDLFCVAEDGWVYTSGWTEGAGDWSGLGGAWRNIGGGFPPGAPVAAVARTQGQLDLFCVGADGRVYTSWWTEGAGDWSGLRSGWRDLGGGFVPGTSIAPVARKPGQLDLFGIGADGRLYTSWWTEGVEDWSGLRHGWAVL